MMSQYIGNKVSKSSSPDPRFFFRKIFFLVCHVTISVVLIGWTVGTTARQHGRALVNKFYQLLFVRAMVNGWEKESMPLFEVDRVFWTCQDFCLGSSKGSPRQKSWRVQKTLSTTKRVMDSLIILIIYNVKMFTSWLFIALKVSVLIVMPYNDKHQSVVITCSSHNRCY